MKNFDPLGAMRTLLRHDVRFIIVGGFAASLRGSTSVTYDLDICYDRAPATYVELADDIRVAIASIDDLLRMKRAAGRPKDLIEVEILSALKEEREKMPGVE